MGSFWSPLFQNAQIPAWHQLVSYIRTCRRIRNSKKIATIRDFHQNICVNSTTIASSQVVLERGQRPELYIGLLSSSSIDYWWVYNVCESDTSAGRFNNSQLAKIVPRASYVVLYSNKTRALEPKCWKLYIQAIYLINPLAIWPVNDPDSCMTFDPINALCYKFGSHRTSIRNFDPSWPLHDLWPQQS